MGQKLITPDTKLDNALVQELLTEQKQTNELLRLLLKNAVTQALVPGAEGRPQLQI
jgi:hypothetical protein